MNLNYRPSDSPDHDFFYRFNELFSILGISQNEFARRIGSTSAFISNIARNKTKPGLDVLQRIALTFDISLDWLLLGKGNVRGKTYIEADWFHTVSSRLALAKLLKLGNEEAKKLIDELLDDKLNPQNNNPMRLKLIEKLTELTLDDNNIVSLYNYFGNSNDEQQRAKDVLIEAINLLSNNDSRDPLSQLINRPNIGSDVSSSKNSIKQESSGNYNRVVAGDYHEK